MARKREKNTTDQLMDRIERLSDEHGVQIGLNRAPGVWIAHAILRDGRRFTAQSPADQNALLASIVEQVERALGV